MNDYLFKKTETKNKQAFEQVQSFLKKMSWRISVPVQLQNLILLFLYPTFFKPVQLYTLASSPVPLISGNEFLLESPTKILKIAVDKQWNAFKYSRELLVQLQRPLMMDFIIKRTQANMQRVIIGTEQEIKLIEDSIKYIKQRLKGQFLFFRSGLNVLHRLIPKNLIILHSDDQSYWIFQNDKNQINVMGMTILFDPKTNIWSIKGPLLWKRCVQISRKKQFIRLSPSILLQSENGQVKQLPSNYFWVNQSEQIMYFIP